MNNDGGIDGNYGIQLAGISFAEDSSGTNTQTLTTGLDTFESGLVFVQHVDAA
jgi:hypothetical protein